MGLARGQILTWLVIGWFICGINGWQDYPAPAYCESDGDCLKGKAKCLRRECHCTDKYAFGDGKKDCKQVKRCMIDDIVGNSCTLGRGDLFKNSHCVMPDNDYGACKCDSGYFGRAGHTGCLSASKFELTDKGGKKITYYWCLTDKNCPIYSKCKGQFCYCADGFKGDGENCQPQEARKCSNDLDCLAKQGRCIDGFCRCVGKYVGNGDYCRKAKTCPDYIKCVDKAECMIDPLLPKTTRCICNPGFWEKKEGKDTICLDCLMTYHCRQRYAICVKGKCSCRDGLVLGKKTCEFAPAKTCYNNAQCPDTKGRCMDGKCRCTGSYVGNGVYCKIAKKCSRNTCGSLGTCLVDPFVSTRTHCQCLPGYKYGKNGQCVECLSNADCNYDENSAECIKGKCKCKDELIRDGKKCKQAPIQVCRAQFDCHTNAKCQKGKCLCQGWYTGNGRYCRASRPCPEVNQCGSHGICLLDPLFLKNPHCLCDEGYEVDNKTGNCSECLSDKDCNTDYSTCVDGECKCKDELIKKPGKICVHARLHLCAHESRNDCHHNAKCIMKRCYCQGLTAGNGRFCRNSLPCPKGHRCDRHSTCILDPLFPKAPHCKCNPGYLKSSKGTCVEMSSCEEKGVDCPDGAKCGAVSSGSMQCICETGYKSIFKNEKLTCQDIDECATGKARCSGDRCTNTVGSYTCIPCPPGFTDGANGLCVGTVQGKCNCKKNEKCRRGKCKCKTGYKRSKQGICVGGNAGSELETSSGNTCHFSCHWSIWIVLGLLGPLGFSR